MFPVLNEGCLLAQVLHKNLQFLADRKLLHVWDKQDKLMFWNNVFWLLGSVLDSGEIILYLVMERGVPEKPRKAVALEWFFSSQQCVTCCCAPVLGGSLVLLQAGISLLGSGSWVTRWCIYVYKSKSSLSDSGWFQAGYLRLILSYDSQLKSQGHLYRQIEWQ